MTPAFIFGRPSCRRRVFDTTCRRSRAPGALRASTDATASLFGTRLPVTSASAIRRTRDL